MPRDYARPRDNGRRSGGNNNSRGGGNARGGAATRRAPEPTSGAGVPGWVYLMVGLAIGLAVAVFMYISRPSNKVVLGAATTATATAAKDDDKKPIPLPPKVPSRFDFYRMLPSYEVVIPRDTVKPAAAPGQQPTAAPTASADVKAAIAAPGQYLIQVGAYRSREEADRARASAALADVEARIEQVTLNENDTWYRVRIGPLGSLESAQETIKRLDDNGIKSMLVKVKS